MRTTIRLAALAAVLALAGGPASAQAGPPLGDASRGQKVFLQCKTCHVAPNAQARVISLAGVIGRKAGVDPKGLYSSAMKSSGIVWDETQIDAYLAGPTKIVPGTSMMTAPLTRAQDRADVIAYIKTLTP